MTRSIPPSLAPVVAQLELLRAVIAREDVLQGLRPDIAKRIEPPATKTWFGPRRPLIRHDGRWQVADTLLPVDPRTLPAAT